MTEPSVEEIVRAYETAKALGLPQNYLGREYADALIADWRKRGEALNAVGGRSTPERQGDPSGAGNGGRDGRDA